MKILYIINVDFALVHFLLPLMRAARARGHDVAAICAEGPLLAAARAEGFRILPRPADPPPGPRPPPASPSAQLRGHAGTQE
jgi:UDP:flavonoid glycosyltransferase YjiC (YdhE family)